MHVDAIFSSSVQFGLRIVDRCAGLPLALKAIGGLMRTKREVDEWRAISQNKIWDGERSINRILPALKLSYDLLPSYMKQCFIFCANFPRNCNIAKETLIQLWKSNDLIPNDENTDVDAKGQYIFRELYWRSFLQDIEEKKNFYGKIETRCKMHGLMHDLAKTIAGKQCATAISEVKTGQVLHLSVMVGDSPNNLNTILKECPTIRTCLIHGKVATKLNNVKHSDFGKSISLRALQMHGCGQPPKQLEYMKHLRYLDLSWGKFDSLPETTSTLYNLHTLNLSYSKVSKLPEDMRYMISLEDLNFDGCVKLKKMPIYLGKLRSLRTLTKYMIDRDPGRSIEELKNLNLHGRLILTGLENVRDRNEAEAANMVSKTKLYSLILTWISPENGRINDGEVLDGLKPSYELKHLLLSGYTGSKFAAWMKDISVIKNLRVLKVYNCHNCTKLPPIWQLPLLENLELKHMRSLVNVSDAGNTEVEESEPLMMFPNLKKLEICYLDNLEEWHEQDHKLVAFPKLEELDISECPKLKSVPFTPMLKKFIIYNTGRIKLLQISNMTMGASSKIEIHICQSPTELDAFGPPKNVVSMKVSGLDNVIPLEENNERCRKGALRHLTLTQSNCFFSHITSKLSLGFWKYFASLERLDIVWCDTLSYWPKEEFRSLQCLKELHIFGCYNFSYSSEEPSLTQTCEEELPRLEKLSISGCPKLVEIPYCSKSLKALEVFNCSSLSKEGLHFLKNLNELKELLLGSCKDLKSLPDGLEYLNSLKRLTIRQCPRMESFPEGLQQRLPALQYLEITRSPTLEELCKNGDYKNLVAAIPSKKFTSDYL